MLENLLTRKIFKVEWKSFGLGVVLSGFFVVTITLCLVIKPYMDPLSIIEVLPRKRLQPLPSSRCNFSGKNSDYCELSGDIRIQANTSSIYFNSSPQLASNKTLTTNTMSIKLYARKSDKFAMSLSKELWLKPTIYSSLSHQQEYIMPKCTITNNTVPALMFFSGGYVGNIFHDAIDLLVPLFITSFHFSGEVQFIAQNRRSWWIPRHEVLFKALSKYEIIDLNHDKETRCFNYVVVGLKYHQEFLIDPNMDPYGLTLRNFTQFNRKIYSLKREIAIKMNVNDAKKPRLLIISRKKTRIILNEDELVKGAQSLGFNVELMDPKMKLTNLSKIVNSMDVMIGIHGAGLTNMVYLPENAVLIQIIGIGMQAPSKVCFERPAIAMNLRYMKYEVGAWESSLIQQYPSNHPIITNPSTAIKGQGWHTFKSIYMDKQDIRLDMTRFKSVLVRALELLRTS